MYHMVSWPEAAGPDVAAPGEVSSLERLPGCSDCPRVAVRSPNGWAMAWPFWANVLGEKDQQSGCTRCSLILGTRYY